MELSKVVLVLCLYIVIKSSALPTTINGTDQSQNAIKQADQDAVQKTTVDNVNTVKLQDDFPQQDYVSQDVKKSTMSKKRCSCKHGANGNADKNMNNHMKCDNNNGHKSSNCQNKKQKCQKGEAGNCGSNGEGSGHGGNEKTESSGYESDKSKYEKGDKPHKEQGKPDGNKTGGYEGQKEETIPEKMIDSWKNVKQQILKKN